MEPKDYIAALALIIILVLKLRGIDGQVDVAAALILGYYFAHRHDHTDNGK